MTTQEFNALADCIVAKLVPRIEKAISDKIGSAGSYGNENLLTLKQLAELLGVHPSSLHGKTDIYPSVMVGSRKRFLRNRVLEMLATR